MQAGRLRPTIEDGYCYYSGRLRKFNKEMTMAVYCGNRFCKQEFTQAPRQCPGCGCIEFVSNIALATGGYDDATEARLKVYWQNQQASGRAGRQQLPGQGRVYRSQAEIDRDRGLR